MDDLAVVGKSVPRTDALEKVTGKARYCADLHIPRMLCARILRSPRPHAVLASIDTSEAGKLPGVRAILTGKDVPAEKLGMIKDRPLLAGQVVRFIGEPVAVVAADDEDTAEQALGLIKVGYEDLPAVFDAEEAMAPDQPVVVHPDIFQRGSQRISAAPHVFEPEMPNVYTHYKIRHGRIEEGFRDAHLVLENRYWTPRLHHSALEPVNVLASPQPDGGVTLWATTTKVHVDRADLCRLLKLPPRKVRIVSPYMGGNFGSKNQSLIVMWLAACLALKTEGPVNLVLSRREQFLDLGSREGMVVYVKDGVRRDGTLVAREMKLVLNIGAYSSGNMISCTKSSLRPVVGIYRVSNLKADAYGVATNEPPAGSYITFGATQVYWALEQQMDILARMLDIDPIEIRKRNILKEGESNASGQPLHGIGVGRCLDKVSTWIGLSAASSQEKGPWKKGKGVAVGCKATTALSTSVVAVKVSEDGAVEVRHSALEQGMGCNTVLTQIAAEEFRTSVEKIKIVSNDTAVTPYDAGTFGHRTTYQTGNALVLACRDAKRKLFELASTKLGVSPDGLDIADGQVFVKGVPKRAVRLAEIFTPLGYLVRGGELVGCGVYCAPGSEDDLQTGQGMMIRNYGYGACAVEVSVNAETGAVRILRLATSFDMGQPLNPKLCEAQMETGIGLGVGNALHEEMRVDNGDVVNSSFMDYKLPSALDMPPNTDEVSLVAGVSSPDGPYGAKGFAESTMVPIAPAIANAVYNAIGVRIKDSPITAEKIVKALKR